MVSVLPKRAPPMEPCPFDTLAGLFLSSRCDRIRKNTARSGPEGSPSGQIV